MLSKEFLEEQYIQQKKPCSVIAKETGWSGRTIHSWLVKYEIPRRDNTKPQNLIDMTGFKVGNLEVIEKSVGIKGRQATWTVFCHQCNIKFDVPGWKIRHRQIGGCKFCGKHPNYRGCGDIPKQYWTSLMKGAIDRNLEFTITIEQAWELLLKQNHLCKLSGLPIKFATKNGRNNKTASLDRIDSSKGYTIDNIQWVHKEVNKLKGKFSDTRLIELCKSIANHNA